MGSGAGLAQAVANNPKLKASLQAWFAGKGFAPQAAPPPPPAPAPVAPPPAPTVEPYKPESLAPNNSFGGQMGMFNPPPEPPPPAPQLPPDVFSNQGAEGAKGATGFKTSKSSWKRAGKATKGTSNLKLQINSNATGTGMNIRG